MYRFIANVVAFLILCFPVVAFCDVSSPFNNGQVYAGRLTNGMKIILKKTSYDPGEIYIRMTAEGGYASLPEDSKAAGVVSPYAALETGFGDISADHFYAEDIELLIELHPYSRTILAFTATYELEKVLSYLNKFFRISEFHDEAFSKAKVRVSNKLKACNFEFDSAFQQAFLDANTQDFKPMKAPELEGINKADIKTSLEIFKRLFTNPSEYTLVVVGDFEPNLMLKTLEENLGSIKSVESQPKLGNPPIPTFPKKPITREVPLNGYHSSMARLSFPITSTNPETYVILSWLEEFLHTRLSAALKNKFKDEAGLEVIFDNPIFPRPELSLFILQFRCNSKDVKKFESLLREELKKLCREGISKEQMMAFTQELKEKDHFWLHDNAYWLTLLADYSAMGWEINSSTGMPTEFSGIELSLLNKLLREIFSASSSVFIYSKGS